MTGRYRDQLIFSAYSIGLRPDMRPAMRSAKGFDSLDNLILDWNEGTFWNPVTEDCDTTRLISAHHLRIDWEEHAVIVSRGVFRERIQFDAEHPAQAALRLAVTLVAAGIGLWKFTARQRLAEHGDHNTLQEQQSA